MTFGHKWYVHKQKDQSMILCFDQRTIGLPKKLSLTGQWQFWGSPFGSWSKQRIIDLSFWLWTYHLWPNVIYHSQWQKFMDKTLKKMSLTMVNDKKIVIYWKWSILLLLFCKVPDSVKDGFSSLLETIDGHWLGSLKTVGGWLGHWAKYSPGVCEWWVTIHGAWIGFSLSESASPQTMQFSHFQPNWSCDWILLVLEVWSWSWSLVFLDKWGRTRFQLMVPKKHT